MDETVSKNGGYGTLTVVWALLIALTLLTVLLSRRAGTGAPVMALSIATAKASLVVYYFMHLRSERGVLRLLIPVAAVLIAIIMALVFSDVAYR